jgi:trehalose 6-phosphate phosphatase
MSTMDSWRLTYDGFDPAEEGLREVLCTLGNGYFATRGCAPEAAADGTHYPGTYVAGVYNRLVAAVAGRRVENESIVNAPNWLPLTFRAAGGPWFGEPGTEVVAHRIELDLRLGVLLRHSELRDRDGRVVRIAQRRLVSMRDPHLAALETTLVPVNWSGRLEVRSALDGTVRNSGVARYEGLGNAHLTPAGAGRFGDGVVWLQVETNQSHVRIAQAARTRVVCAGRPIDASAEMLEHDGWVALQYAFDVEQGSDVLVEKVIALFTSRDPAISEPARDACDYATNVAGSFDALLARHAIALRSLWERMDIRLGTDGEIARALHLHLFHVLQTVSNNSLELDVGVPARGLHGEAYRGHVFWDELFLIPLLCVRVPELAGALLRYRFRRLEHARRAAAAAGYAGAMFPWQSASSGREETQTMHFNPRSGRWVPDGSRRQRHVNAAVAYNTWLYYDATGDIEFLRGVGAELLVEIARFWTSAATYNGTLDRYEIKGVMGPDEYHEAYPDREQPGLDNNAYTNLMAVWCICRAFDALAALPAEAARELHQRLEITQQELERWDEVSRRMRVCFHDGVISQFEGYERLEELDWLGYVERYGDIERLDRILEAEGDTANRYKVAKQADVLMLLYLLPAHEITQLLERLGYECDDQLLERTVEYYEPRTAHGSTLSRIVHAWLHARLDTKHSWQCFVHALRSDIDDVQHGTTKEGIHLGAMAGTLDLVQRCYTGLRVRGEVLHFDPALPSELPSLAFTVHHRRRVIDIEVTMDFVRARLAADALGPTIVGVRGEIMELRPGETIDVKFNA